MSLRNAKKNSKEAYHLMNHLISKYIQLVNLIGCIKVRCSLKGGKFFILQRAHATQASPIQLAQNIRTLELNTNY